MSHPRSAQEWVHWIEVGAGARPILRAAAVVGLLVLSLAVANKQFHGPAHEMTLLQADVGRQLAAGRGFTTLVNYPQTVALMEERHRVLAAQTESYPELQHAPLYSMVIAGGLWILPSAWRDALFTSAPTPPDGFAADYYLLGLNLALLWLAAWQTFRFGSQLFDDRVGWVAMLALMLSVGVWNQVVLVNGLPLLMVLALAAFRLLAAIEPLRSAENADPAPLGRGDTLRLFALGGIGALLFLAEYSAGLLLVVVAGYVGRRVHGRARWIALTMLTAGFLIPVAPWAVRNLVLTGSPVGLAWQNVALKAGDSTAEPSVQRTLFTTEPPKLDLNKLGNKGLTGVQLNIKDRLWSGGGYFVVAFFVAGWLYQFRGLTANRMRWVFTAVLLVLVVGAAVPQFRREPAFARLLFVASTPGVRRGFLFCAGREQFCAGRAQPSGGSGTVDAAGGAPRARFARTARHPFPISPVLSRLVHAPPHGDGPPGWIPAGGRHGGRAGWFCLVWTAAGLGAAGPDQGFLPDHN